MSDTLRQNALSRLQILSSRLCSETGCDRAVDADIEGVIGHRVSQYGSSIHGTKGAAWSTSRPPGLRPHVIPAGRNCDRGSRWTFRRHRLRICAKSAEKNGHSYQLEPGTPAARNDGWGPTVMTTAGRGRGVSRAARRRRASARRDTCRSDRWHQVVVTDVARLPPLRRIRDSPRPYLPGGPATRPQPRERGGRRRA